MMKPHPAVVRALIFDGIQPGRAISPASLAQSSLPDTQLLWVDHSGPLDQALLHSSALDNRAIENAVQSALGVVVSGEWKYFSARAINWRGQTHEKPVDMVLAVGPNRVATIHPAPIEFLDALLENESENLSVGNLDAMSFAAALLDRMLTDYMDAKDAFDDEVDRIELMILHQPSQTHLRQLQSMRRTTSRLRQCLAIQRDMFDAMGRIDFDLSLSTSATTSCERLSARYSRVVQSVEGARELVNGSLALYTSRMAESTNKTMHTLTIITMVMGLAAIVAGVLGMNFQAALFNASETGFWVASFIILGMVLLVMGWAIRRHRIANPQR